MSWKAIKPLGSYVDRDKPTPFCGGGGGSGGGGGGGGGGGNGITELTGVVLGTGPGVTTTTFGPGAAAALGIPLVIGAGNSIKTHGSITSGLTNLACPDAAFTILDIGKTVVVLGAGTAGSDLSTTVASVPSSHALELAAAAGTTVVGSVVYYGTDDTTGFLAALAAVPVGGGLEVKRGPGGGGYLITGTHATSVPLTFDPGALFHIPVPGWTFTGTIQADVSSQVVDTGSITVANRVITGQSNVSPSWFGARGDFTELTDCVLTSSSATVTSASASFTSADVGKTFAAYQVDYTDPVFGIVTVLGVAQGVYGVIRTVNSAHSVTLSTASNVSHSGCVGNYATIANIPFQRALSCVDAAGGGVVQVASGTFAFTNPPAADGNSILIELYDYVTLSGSGREATVLTQFANNETFSRLIGAYGTTGTRIEHLTVDGNKIPQINSAEHQHGVFFRDNSGAPMQDAQLYDVVFQNTRGDGLYLYAGPVDTLVDNCVFQECNRTSIHAQTFDGLTVTNNIFRNSTGQGHIKGEPDGPNQFGQRAVIANNMFVQDAGQITTAFGVLIAGSDGYNTRDISVTGNSFRNMDQTVVLGIYNVGVAVVGNVYDDCGQALSSSNFALAYGFTGNSHVVFTGNTVRECKNILNTFPVQLSNSSDIVVSSNVIQGTSLRSGVSLTYCRNAVISGNVLQAENAVGYIGYYLSRVSGARVDGNIIEMHGTTAGGSYAIYVDDAYLVAAYDTPMQDIAVGQNTLFGSFYAGYDFLSPASPNARNISFVPPMAQTATFGAGGAVMDSRSGGLATEAIFGYQQLPADFQAGNGRKITYGPAVPTSDALVRTWAVGDMRVSTAANTVSGGKILYAWICSVAGTPGTWTPFYLSA